MRGVGSSDARRLKKQQLSPEFREQQERSSNARIKDNRFNVNKYRQNPLLFDS